MNGLVLPYCNCEVDPVDAMLAILHDRKQKLEKSIRAMTQEVETIDNAIHNVKCMRDFTRFVELAENKYQADEDEDDEYYRHTVSEAYNKYKEKLRK